MNQRHLVEGGSAAVIKDEDSLDNHFNDTVGGGDWLCEQDVVEYFVKNATREMIQMEQWGCPWSRKENGEVNVRRFGGMKVERTWFAADKTGFHMLHTLFQTSMKYDNIKRFDEYFVVDLLVDEGEVQGLIAIHMSEGELVTIKAKSVVLATGGAGRVYHCNTNGGIVTGRKNWLFANNPNGAEASAMLYSIVETAKANDLILYDYMVKCMKELAKSELTTPLELLTLKLKPPWDKGADTVQIAEIHLGIFLQQVRTSHETF